MDLYPHRDGARHANDGCAPLAAEHVRCVRTVRRAHAPVDTGRGGCSRTKGGRRGTLAAGRAPHGVIEPARRKRSAAAHGQKPYALNAVTYCWQVAWLPLAACVEQPGSYATIVGQQAASLEHQPPPHVCVVVSHVPASPQSALLMHCTHVLDWVSHTG